MARPDSATAPSATRPVSRPSVQLGDGGGVPGDHEARLAGFDVGAPGRVDGVEQLLRARRIDAAVGLVGGDGRGVPGPELDAGGLLPLGVEAADVGELGDEITAVLDEEREGPAGFHRRHLAVISQQARSWNRHVVAALTSSSRVKVPASELSSIMTSCPGLRRRSEIACSVSASLARSLAALGERGVGVPGEVEGETLPPCGQLGDAPLLGEPLGGVLGLDPELVSEHLRRGRGGGETDDRPRTVDLFPHGAKSRHGG